MKTRTAMKWPLLAGIGLACASAMAGAHTFTVTTTDDSSTGSLSQAITDANGDSDASSTVAFAIPGSGPHTITLTSALPSITHSMIIDGYSQQPGSVMNTNTPDDGGLNGSLQVELTSGSGSVTQGFLLGAKDGVTLTVQGLVINRFSNAAIVGLLQAGTSQINVYGNYIGTTVDGTSKPGESTPSYGVSPISTPVQIGGQLPAQRNLISGALVGLELQGDAIVEGNLIGTDVTGTLAIPNTGYGVVLGLTSALGRIGGSAPGARNIISGNGNIGIQVTHSYTGGGPVDWTIQGNYIGTDWSGTQRLPNGTLPGNFHGGIELASEPQSFVPVIGGFDPGEANLIAWNIGPGIFNVENYIGSSFDNHGNVIHHNDGGIRLNVDIGPSGRTVNDAGDADAGSNNLQNWPQILSASQSGNQLTITYMVDTATANATYPLYVDFYRDIQGGSGAFLGEDVYDAAHAQISKTAVLTLPSAANATQFVATVTDSNGYSSEFSPAWDVIFEGDFE